MITIAPYKEGWVAEFQLIAAHLRQALGDLAIRIDHIGSTSVPHLAAKDIIDVQITVAALNNQLAQALEQAGYRQMAPRSDHLPPGGDPDPSQWSKWLYKPAQPQRPINVHVRLIGRANQRYALLFRDYLRAFPPIAQAYAQVKTAIVANHPEDDMEAYYNIKDPVCDIIVGGASYWASRGEWHLGPSDC